MKIANEVTLTAERALVRSLDRIYKLSYWAERLLSVDRGDIAAPEIARIMAVSAHIAAAADMIHSEDK